MDPFFIGALMSRIGKLDNTDYENFFRILDQLQVIKNDPGSVSLEFTDKLRKNLIILDQTLDKLGIRQKIQELKKCEENRLTQKKPGK